MWFTIRNNYPVYMYQSLRRNSVVLGVAAVAAALALFAFSGCTPERERATPPDAQPPHSVAATGTAPSLTIGAAFVDDKLHPEAAARITALTPTTPRRIVGRIAKRTSAPSGAPPEETPDGSETPPDVFHLPNTELEIAASAEHSASAISIRDLDTNAIIRFGLIQVDMRDASGSLLATQPAATVSGRIEGSRVVYADVAPGLDLRVGVLGTRLQHDFVYDERPQLPGGTTAVELVERLDHSDGLVPRVDGVDLTVGETRASRRPVVLGTSTTSVFLVPAPTLEEHNNTGVTGEFLDSSAVHYSATRTSPTQLILTTHVDSAWLLADGRRYPVVIDPPIDPATPARPNGPVIASIDINPIVPGSLTVRVAVVFGNFYNDPLNWRIDWGDGTILGGRGAAPLHELHVYGEPGAYEVLFEVCDDETPTRCAQHERRTVSPPLSPRSNTHELAAPHGVLTLALPDTWTAHRADTTFAAARLLFADDLPSDLLESQGGSSYPERAGITIYAAPYQDPSPDGDALVEFWTRQRPEFFDATLYSVVGRDTMTVAGGSFPRISLNPIAGLPTASLQIIPVFFGGASFLIVTEWYAVADSELQSAFPREIDEILATFRFTTR